MTLKLFEFLTYLCSGLVCFVLGIILIGIKNDMSRNAVGFRKVKVFVACAAFLDVIVDMAVIRLMYVHADYLIVNYVFAPTIFFVQLYMGAASLLALFRFPKIGNRSIMKFVLPIVFITVLHYVLYVFNYEAGFDPVQYAEYVHGTLSKVISSILYIVIAAEAVCLGTWMIKAVHRYNRLLSEYYSGDEILKGRKLTSVNYAFFLYFALAMLNLLCQNTVISAVVICVTTVLFLIFVVALINLQRLFTYLSPAFVYASDNTVATPESAGEELTEIPSGPVTEVVASDGRQQYLDEKVRIWSTSPSKPYLRDGLTISMAAEEMGVSYRMLSDFLNSIYEMNFSAWINSLRVEEVMRILDASPRTPISQLAKATGLSDASNCSKVFRKITGMTISQYREALK